MGLYELFVARIEKIALVGLGYVGMPIAVAFARKADVIGFDLNHEKIKLYKSGIDPTKEVGDEAIRDTSVQFTSDEEVLDDVIQGDFPAFLFCHRHQLGICEKPDIFRFSCAARYQILNLRSENIF